MSIEALRQPRLAEGKLQVPAGAQHSDLQRMTTSKIIFQPSSFSRIIEDWKIDFFARSLLDMLQNAKEFDSMKRKVCSEVIGCSIICLVRHERRIGVT
jgi:hypothetical protein